MVSIPFKLSSVLFGHSLDVRAVAVSAGNCIVSGSRDKTAKYWKPNSMNTGYTESITLKGHKNFVSSVCVLEPSASYPNGVILTGGNDNLICIFTTDSEEPITVLKGHSDTVCNLSKAISPETVLSSSWDCTAKLWKVNTHNELVTFTGHQAAVWAVIQMSNGHVVTGAADKQIIIWDKSGTKIKTLTGHTDCVRGLAILNDQVFISVANDAAVKQWTIGGECLKTCFGHTNYIYSVCVNKRGQDESFVTSGEDHTVRYWQGGENTQTITLPAQSVWSVACLSNGDIVTGSSDGVVRIFTQDPDRTADDTVLKTFEEEVNSIVAASTQEIGGVKLTDLPGREVLYEPGRSDGQTKLIREGASVQCYSWSAAEGRWNKVGDVLGAAGGTQATSGKTLYEGKEYDFVFSVDIEDGKPPLKLPYNRADDPWVAAQAFIHKNNLSQMFLEQVANFIITNSAGGPPAATTGTFVDPFTGGSRYVPGLGSGPTTGTAGNADPFTGGSSYTTSAPRPALNFPAVSSGANADVFTGADSYNSNTSQPSTLSTQRFIPQRSYLRFDQANINAIYDKLKEFNSKQGDGNRNIDESTLEGVMKLATEGSPDKISVQALIQLLNWPRDILFPVLDITRLAVRHPDINQQICAHENKEFMVDLLKTLTSTECSVVANQMLAFRILSNMFNNAPGESLALTNKEIFLHNVLNLGTNLSKNVQIALCTMVLNYSIALNKTKDVNGLEMVVHVFIHLMPRITEPEAHFRLLVATGTLVYDSSVLVKSQLIAKLNSDSEFHSKIADICNLANIGEIGDPALSKMVSCALQLSEILK